MTTPTPTTYLGQALQAPAVQLANCAPFRALVGAATPAAALDRILLWDPGIDYEADQSTFRATAMSGAAINLTDGGAWAHCGMDMPSMTSTQTIPHQFERAGSMLIRLAIPRPAGHPAQAFIAAADIVGAIETAYLGTFGSGTYLSMPAGDVRAEFPPQPPPRSWASGLLFAHLTIDWRSLP